MKIIDGKSASDISSPLLRSASGLSGTVKKLRQKPASNTTNSSTVHQNRKVSEAGIDTVVDGGSGKF